MKNNRNYISSAENGKNLERNQTIDFFRFIAVVSVLLFHFGLLNFNKGYLGVDIFFLISGFLMAQIISNDLSSNIFEFKSFILKRICRIFPTMIVMIVSVNFFTYIFFQPSEVKHHQSASFSTIIFLSNVYFWRTTGYFNSNAQNSSLLHTWSLGIEFQFYCALALLTLIIRRKLNQEIWLKWFGIFGLLSFAFFLYFREIKSIATFFLIPFRFWEFSLGGLIYHLRNARILKFTTKLVDLSLFLLIFFLIAIFSITQFDFPGIIPVLSSFVIVGYVVTFSNKSKYFIKFIEMRIFQIVGAASYSVYLWHQPIHAIMKRFKLSDLTINERIIGFCASLVLGVISYLVIEKNLNYKKFGIFKKRSKMLSSLLLFSILSTLMLSSHQIYFGLKNSRAENLYYKRIGSEIFPDSKCKISDTFLSPSIKEKFDKCAKLHKAIFIIGDSHAIDVYNMFRRSNFPFIVGLGQGGCRAHENSSYCNLKEQEEFIFQNRKRINRVIYSQSGMYLFTEKQTNLTVNRDSFHKSKKPVFRINQGNVESIKIFLNRIYSKSRIPTIFIGPWLENHLNGNRLIDLSSKCEVQDVPHTLTHISNYYKELDEYLAKKFKALNTVHYISSINLMEINWELDLIGCRNSIYSDTDHLSYYGEQRYWRRFVSSIINYNFENIQ